jgi:hypothetical protein
MRSFRAFGAGLARSRRFLGRRLGSYPLQYYALIGLLGVVVAVGAQTPTSGTYNAVPAPPQSSASPAAPSSPMDQALQLVGQAQHAYQGVRDYSCLLVKQERVRGKLLPENLIELQFRVQPFSVSMRWLAPREFNGQQVCYVAGRNNDMMRVHASGLKGIAGFISVAVRDPRVFEHSAHTITETGIGNLIEQLRVGWEAARRLNKTQVQIAEYEYNRRRCTRVELVRTDRTAENCPFCRTVAYFDKENHLPIRVELYGWPQMGGNPSGDLMECYSYANLRLNVGVPDAVFNH